MNLYVYYVNDKGVNDLCVVKDAKGNIATSKKGYKQALRNYNKRFKNKGEN